MSISTTDRKAGPFVGNGVTTAFDFEFKVFSSADVLVVKTALDGTDKPGVRTSASCSDECRWILSGGSEQST
jgi:hypothetical protein